MSGFGFSRYVNENDRVVDSWRAGHVTFRECSRRVRDLWILHLIWCVEHRTFGDEWRPARRSKLATVYRFPTERTRRSRVAAALNAEPLPSGSASPTSR